MILISVEGAAILLNERMKIIVESTKRRISPFSRIDISLMHNSLRP